MANMCSRDPQHEEILMASSYGKLDIVENLLQSFPQIVNFADDLSWTPLILAASSGHALVCEFLISHHADLNLQTKVSDCSCVFFRSGLPYPTLTDFITL